MLCHQCLYLLDDSGELGLSGLLDLGIEGVALGDEVFEVGCGHIVGIGFSDGMERPSKERQTASILIA